MGDFRFHGHAAMSRHAFQSYQGMGMPCRLESAPLSIWHSGPRVPWRREGRKEERKVTKVSSFYDRGVFSPREEG